MTLAMKWKETPYKKIVENNVCTYSFFRLTVPLAEVVLDQNIPLKRFPHSTYHPE